MSDVVEVAAVEAEAGVPAGAVGLDAGDVQLLAVLAGRAAAKGLSLAGEGGFLQQMTKLVLEAGLEAEMSAHLGYERHAAAGVPAWAPWPARRRRPGPAAPGCPPARPR